jgi:transposase
MQEQCVQCARWIRKRTGEKHHLCRSCNNARIHGPQPSSSPSPPSPPPLFPSHAGNHAPLPLIQRAAIVVLNKEGRIRTDIAQQVGTSLPTVRHWLQHFEEKNDLSDKHRSGRPRCTDEAMDAAIVGAAYVENNFCTPRGLKRKHQLEPSARTIDRRLQEANLFGRVARHKKQMSSDEKRKRLSFAEGYKHMTEDDWMKVMFADEKKFKGDGFMGQIWVRRPKGEADNPAYSVQKLPHPVKLNVWGCFCGRGLGYCYIFDKNMNAKLLKKILGSHLIESAQLHFEQDPPELWHLLQDNDPKHKSVLVRTWLHNNGISMLDFPPYSPDLNPIENLWNHLARRVESRPASTMDELQDVIAEEWEATPVAFLETLARSMPKRCQAVIEAKGELIHY